MYRFIDTGGSLGWEGGVVELLARWSMIYLRFFWLWFLFFLGFFATYFYVVFFWGHGRLFVLILSSKTAAPNVKINGSIMEILTFLKNSRFCIERSVWELFGTFFGFILVYFMVSLGLLHRSNLICRFLFFVLKKNWVCPKNNVELNVVKWTCQRRWRFSFISVLLGDDFGVLNWSYTC